ncbi:MAG: hypothetical protein P1U34_08080 [Coxiellaceae bacterium]|nr:hypothetical protein [Coxiellaceae bacterium]
MRRGKMATIKIYSLEDYMSLVNDYLHRRDGENYNIDYKIGDHLSIASDQLRGQDSKANFLARAAHHYIHQNDTNVMLRRRQIVSLLSVAISGAKKRNAGEQPLEMYDNKARVDALKAAIAGDHKSWKQVLLAINQVELVKASGTQHTFSRDVMSDDAAIMPSKRVDIRAYESKIYSASAAVAAGSSFVTNKMDIIRGTLGQDGELVPHVSLDAAYSAVSKDGFVVAIADGCGGHFDKIEDSAIRRAAKFNVKSACRLIETCSAEELSDESFRHIFFDRIAQETIAKNPRHRDAANSTLIVARGVTQPDGSVQLYGIGVGDCSLVGYNARTGEVYNFLSACQQGWGTASVPGARSLVEERFFSVNIPADTIILPLTDGITDDLDSETVESGRLRYSSIKPGQLIDILAPLGGSPSAQDCLTAIVEHVFAKAERKRLAAKDTTPEMFGLLAKNEALRERLALLQSQQNASPADRVYDNFLESSEFKAENQAIRASQSRVVELFCQNGDDVTALAVVPALTQGFYASSQHTLFKPVDLRVPADAGGSSQTLLEPKSSAKPIVATRHSHICCSTRLNF